TPTMVNPSNAAMSNSMMMSGLPLAATPANSLALAARQNLARFMNPFASGSNNPYMMAYGMSSGYGSGASSGYGGGQSGGQSGGAQSGGGGSGYGNSGGLSHDQSALAANSYADPSAACSGMQLSSALTALGISNKNGQLDWPLAFRLFPPGEDRNAMTHAESVLQLALLQGAGGKAAATILKEATRDVHKLRRWLREHQVDMAEATYQAGSAYLGRVEGALKLIASN